MTPSTLLVVAANGGAGWPPDWLLNLDETPIVEVVLHERCIKGRARILDASERQDRWVDACMRFPGLDLAQAGTDRQIDLVELQLEDVPRVP